MSKLLIDKGADVNCKSRDGVTALMLAVSKDYVEIVKLLLDKGANAKIRYKNGGTVLKIARQRGSSEILKMLKINEKDEAVIVIEYPKMVHAGSTYEWTTVFKETGGKYGFNLKSYDFYILDPKGGRWSNSWSETVEVKAGESATTHYWCDKSDNWVGGTYHTVWIGEDDLGNEISIVQEVKLAP